MRFQLLSSLQADDDTYCSWLRYAPLQQSLLHCWKWITYKKFDQLDQDQTEAKDFRDRRTVSKSEKYRNSLNFNTHTRHAIILCRQISKLANFEHWSLLLLKIREKMRSEIREKLRWKMVSYFKFWEMIDFSADPASQWWNKRHKLLEIQGLSLVAGAATGTEIYPWENSKCSWLFCWRFHARCVKAF